MPKIREIPLNMKMEMWTFPFNRNELYILTYAFFQSFFDIEIAIEIRQVYKRSIKLPITLVLARRAVKF